LIHHSPSQNPSSGGERNACNPLTSLTQTRLVDTKLFSPVGSHSRGAYGDERLQCFCFSESRADSSEQNLELGNVIGQNLAHNLASKGRLQSGVNVMHSSQKQDNCFSNNKRCTCVGFLEAMASANDPCLPPHVSVRGGKPRLWTEAEKVLESGEGVPISCSLTALRVMVGATKHIHIGARKLCGFWACTVPIPDRGLLHTIRDGRSISHRES
jgi:hypothetical protein